MGDCCLSFTVPTYTPSSVCGRDSGARWRAAPIPEPESPRTPFIFPFFLTPSATPLTAPPSPPLTPVQRHPLPSQPTNLGDQPRLPASPRPQKGTLKGSGQPLRAPLRGGGGPGAARHEAAPPRLAPPRPRSAALPEPPLGTCMEPTHLQAGQGQGEDEGQEHAEIHPGFRPRRLRAHGRRAPARQGRAAS